MHATHLRRRLAAPAAAVLLASLAACGGGDDDPAVAAPIATPTASADTRPATTTLVSEKYASPFVGVRTAAAHMPETAGALAMGLSKAAGKPGADTKAAELGATLQYLLSEYVYLSTLAMDIELVKPDDPRNSDAIEALDANSVALADVIGELGTPAQRTAFLKGWRAKAKALVDSAISNDEAVDAAAAKEINASPTELARVLGQAAKGELDVDEFAADLLVQLRGLSSAHQSVKNKEDVAFRKLNTAAAGFGELATTLTEALAEGAKLAGDPDSAGAKNRAEFSRLLTAHVYLTATAVLVDYSPPGVLELESSNSVLTALGDNTSDLSGAVGLLAPEFRSPFDISWAAHINDVVAYAKAASAKDSAAATRALASLEAYRTNAGKLLNEASKGELPADAVAKAFETHIESLTGTVDALAKRLAGALPVS
ncbi:MAG: hypothetical protein ACT4QG_19815 [Sporichthyaceae bacterium]